MPLIFDIKRFALHDGPGIRTTIFFKGCPLRCQWCHNPESHCSEPESYAQSIVIDDIEVSRTKIYGKNVSDENLMIEALKDKVFFDESGGGVTFSGGEPLMQHNSLLFLLKELGKHQIHRSVDTSGYASAEKLLEISEHTDLFLYDLKQMNPVKHKEFTGVDNNLILSNAKMLMDEHAEIVFRIPLIPGVNDSEEDINDFLEYLTLNAGRFKEIHLLPFHQIASEKYKRLQINNNFSDEEELGDENIEKMKNKFESCGLRVSVGG